MCSYRRCQSSTVQARVPYSRRVLLHHRGSALMNIRNANAIFVAKKKKKFSSPAWALQRVVLRLPLYPTYLPGRRIEHGGRFCRRHITEKLFWVGRAGHPGQVVGKNDEGKSFFTVDLQRLYSFVLLNIWMNVFSCESLSAPNTEINYSICPLYFLLEVHPYTRPMRCWRAVLLCSDGCSWVFFLAGLFSHLSPFSPINSEKSLLGGRTFLLIIIVVVVLSLSL